MIDSFYRDTVNSQVAEFTIRWQTLLGPKATLRRVYLPEPVAETVIVVIITVQNPSLLLSYLQEARRSWNHGPLIVFQSNQNQCMRASSLIPTFIPFARYVRYKVVCRAFRFSEFSLSDLERRMDGVQDPRVKAVVSRSSCDSRAGTMPVSYLSSSRASHL